MTSPRRTAKSAAISAALSGAVDLSTLKANADAKQKAAAAKANPPSSSAEPGAVGSPSNVLDVTEATFQSEVVERSLKQLVIVDLWAEWCGPCKQLSPVLERLASQSNGAWVLAKVDVDANPRIAQLFGAQSIPTVVAIAAGQPVDAFSGALPEPEIRKWLAALLDALKDKLPGIAAAGAEAVEPPEDERFTAAEDAMARADYTEAEAAYQRILDAEPGNELAKAGLNQARFAGRASKLDASVLAQADASPEDVPLQLSAADFETAQGLGEAAFSRLISLVSRVYGDDRVRVREHLVRLFELFDPADERVLKARRDLASALF